MGCTTRRARNILFIRLIVGVAMPRMLSANEKQEAGIDKV
jgi:hypothetical protein